jgi:hypothetical protein
VNTYPEMNAKIIDLLRLSDDPKCLYAAERIEALERENADLREALRNLLLTRGALVGPC